MIKHTIYSQKGKRVLRVRSNTQDRHNTCVEIYENFNYFEIKFKKSEHNTFSMPYTNRTEVKKKVGYRQTMYGCWNKVKLFVSQQLDTSTNNLNRAHCILKEFFGVHRNLVNDWWRFGEMNQA